MAIVRGDFDQPFVPIWNATARDRRLSFRARGVLTYILSLPPGARVTVETIAAEGAEGREAIATAVRELEAAGYVRRVRAQNERGQWHTDTHVYGTPQAATEAGNPGPENPCPVPPAQTRESPGQTEPQKTGVRRAGAQKKKTGEKTNYENEPLGRAASPSSRSFAQSRASRTVDDAGLTPGVPIPPVAPPPPSHAETARAIADRVAAAGKCVTLVREMVVALVPYLERGEDPERLERVALTLRTVSSGRLGVALDREDEQAARAAGAGPVRPLAPRPGPPPPPVHVAQPVKRLSPEELAVVKARNAELRRGRPKVGAS